jgi:hypothetical protein
MRQPQNYRSSRAMNANRWATIALAIAVTATACAEKAQAPIAPAAAVEADNWEPGKDLAGTQVVIGGVSQEVPEDVATGKRKLDAVAADYESQMDELERERQKKFANDADIRP